MSTRDRVRPSPAAPASPTLSALLFALAWLFAACATTNDGAPNSAGNPAGGTGGSLVLTCTGPYCTDQPAETACVPGISIKQAGATSDKCAAQTKVIDWTAVPDAAGAPDAFVPPTTETYGCPTGTVRVHIRDIWSSKANPTLNKMAERPLAVSIVDVALTYSEFGARQDSAGCDWYSVCLPSSPATTILLKPVGADACSSDNGKVGPFDVSALAGGSDIYIDYTGTSSQLAADAPMYPPPTASGHFRVTANKADVASELCTDGRPDTTIPDGFTKLHIRWMWGDPAKTGFPGTGCGEDKLGYATPPYPTSLKVVAGQGCQSMQAMLEFQDGVCPWYYVLFPNSAWTGAITIRSGDEKLFSPALTLPSPRAANEYWLGYAGAPDNTAMFGTACMNWSQRSNVYYFYTTNPGPGYSGCGGDTTVKTDPCSPTLPTGYSTVHFRYIWAGQKTFTFFPKPGLMPRWIVLEVNGGGGDKDIICYREQDRPWFNCPVPNAEFHAGAQWRAVDKNHSPEWNTVTARPFPDKPAEYWLRWDYGKPDTTSGEFTFFDYYPDGTGGDWSATGNWNDQSCAPKPPATPVKVGYSYGGWFPYTRTHFAYPFGASLAHVYADSASVQDMLNTFVFQRYEKWKAKYVVSDSLVCGAGTARIATDPGPTVSEGQGYGMAMAAAIGDRDTFDKLWNLVRHYLSQSAKKYCGGFMGWMWDGAKGCRAIDQPCDPDKDGCGGNQDSAFDGDVDMGIALVYAARQWPEYQEAAAGWLLKMECEVNAAYDPKWAFPSPGDTFSKDCSKYPGQPCFYPPGKDLGGAKGSINLSYYPPGYFRVFGDYLAGYLDPLFYTADERKGHQAFWYKTAETVYEMYERCYDNAAVNPGLVTDWGMYATPCGSQDDNYNWSRALWRVAIDAAWFGNRTDLPENAANSSPHYPGKSRMQAKIDNIQAYYNDFYKDNPPEPNANRFSTLCKDVTPSGTAKGCDPAFDHNSYFVNTAMCAYANVFDDGGATTPDIRKEALEEAVSTTVENDKYYQESIGVYTMLFLSGNFPNPMQVP